MTMQTTKWKPDTCGCELEYSWDDTVPQDERVHVPTAVKRCAAHAHLDVEGSWTEVMDENQSKNHGIGLLCKEHPELKPQDIKWKIKADRSVEITLPDEAKGHKDSMNGLALGKFKKQVSFE